MIIETLNKELVASMKERNALKMGVIRFFLSAAKNKEVELRPQGLSLTEEDLTKVYKKQIKTRRQVIEDFKKANRQDLVDKEQEELDVLLSLSHIFPMYSEQS